MKNLSLGCHNLTGGSSYPRSARIVHCALDLGIRRFDVAPSYGLGTAETTLATALGKRRLDPAIEITTKYGILAPRFGRLAVWLREPYRVMRQLGGRNQVSGIGVSEAGGSATFTGTALGAAEASLRAMGLERIGAYLSHERLNNDLADRFGEDMATLLRRGLIGKAGCSGEPGNVTSMLAKGQSAATVAQVSVRHREGFPGVEEIRLFNLGIAARTIAKTGRQPVMDSLRDALPGRDDLDEVGRALAAVLAWGRIHVPKAVLLVNASSADRLSSVIDASTQAGLAEWVRQNPFAIPSD
jgi:hypothetical protein